MTTTNLELNEADFITKALELRNEFKTAKQALESAIDERNAIEYLDTLEYDKAEYKADKAHARVRDLRIGILRLFAD